MGASCAAVGSVGPPTVGSECDLVPTVGGRLDGEDALHGGQLITTCVSIVQNNEIQGKYRPRLPRLVERGRSQEAAQGAPPLACGAGPDANG